MDKPIYAGTLKIWLRQTYCPCTTPSNDTFFARGPPYLFGQQLSEMTMNQDYTLLCMVTGETQSILVVAIEIEIYLSRDTEANIKLPAKLFDIHFRAVFEWIKEIIYS